MSTEQLQMALAAYEPALMRGRESKTSLREQTPPIHET
jgi:hypothetical protein